MKLVLFYNPRSGKGEASRAAIALERALRPHGHEAAMVEAFNGTTSSALAAPLAWADALVVLGGDGTLHSTADAAIAAQKPVYQVPFGTENLFARQFGMDRRASTLVRALEHGKIAEVDVGACNGRTFVLMCSVGPDASVIHRLAKVRKGRINHLSYIKPIFQEAFSPSIAPLTVIADGRVAVERQRGIVIIANSRQYALRVDPARDALMDDGKLDVVFLPATTPLGILFWFLKARLGRHRASPNLVYLRAATIRIESADKPLPIQLDGEAAGIHSAESGTTPLDVEIRARRLKVLSPT